VSNFNKIISMGFRLSQGDKHATDMANLTDQFCNFQFGKGQKPLLIYLFSFYFWFFICLLKRFTTTNYVNYFISMRANTLLLLSFSKLIADPSGRRSKAWDCRHSLAGIAGSNPSRGIGVCLL